MSSPAAPPIRLLLELDRADDPKLYDELSRFRKGAKRVARLRLLAHDGLVVGVEGSRDSSVALRTRPDGIGPPPALDAARMTGHAFDEPVDDESS